MTTTWMAGVLAGGPRVPVQVCAVLRARSRYSVSEVYDRAGGVYVRPSECLDRSASRHSAKAGPTTSSERHQRTW
jgi:hypothetical protein